MIVVALQNAEQVALGHIDADDAENAVNVSAASDQRDDGKDLLRL